MFKESCVQGVIFKGVSACAAYASKLGFELEVDEEFNLNLNGGLDNMKNGGVRVYKANTMQEIGAFLEGVEYARTGKTEDEL